MQEKALVYGVVAWLACWLVDLIIIVARGPVLIDPILKLVIVLICLAIILFGLSRQHWLLA
ncbi:MAG TPA: hypothetical protein VL614_00525 [Acetobacteraceae bacterium]|jgi:hypothetical protein|nr:hypothetical protein [Acetobacteraceae bacterium]